ncbi:hypothetical protein [Methylophaga sp.]|uniref:hypothetical protein n=1 Tax=Methylophaga sp. TaxID=2024840 RepID=UPI003A90A796
MSLLKTNFGLIPVINPTSIATTESIDGDETIVFSPQTDVVYHINDDTENTATIFAGTVRGIDKGQVFTLASPTVCELVER